MYFNLFKLHMKSSDRKASKCHRKFSYKMNTFIYIIYIIYIYFFFFPKAPTCRFNNSTFTVMNRFFSEYIEDITEQTSEHFRQHLVS